MQTSSRSRGHRLTLGIAVGLIVGLGFTSVSQAERLSLSGLKTQIDAIDARLINCEQGIGGVCQGSGGQLRNVVTVALDGGDFTGIQAAIDSIPEREVPGSNSSPPQLEVTPTLIIIAPGEYFGQLNLRSNIHLQGAGRGQSIVQVPNNVNFCVFTAPVICLQQLSNVTISGLTISGLSTSGDNPAETAIAIEESSGVNIHNNRISEVAYGIVGELVGDIAIRNNHIPTPADAVVLSMDNASDTEFGPLSVASIVANHIDGGRINVNSEGDVKIMENIIAGGSFNEWRGAIHASGNQIVGDIQFDAEEDSIFNNNTILGSLLLQGSKMISVIGNRISGSGFLIVDNGKATIVGNTLLSDSNPILLALNGNSTVFANDHESSAGDAPDHNQLTSKHAIQLESRNENVIIKAGDSTIVVDANGDITIDSVGDLALTADGKFSVRATTIDIKSTLATKIEAGSNLDLKSTATTSVDGNVVDIDGATRVKIDGGALTDINGGVIRLN